MGLTAVSSGRGAADKQNFKELFKGDKVIALAGNPNVGKSTVFNALTGMKQHTGNWAGKTVTNAVGNFNFQNTAYSIVDIPGTYSLCPTSAEEEVARDFICFGESDAIIIVCDASLLQRCLPFVLQILEITQNAVLCVNLMDEAERKGITPDLNIIAARLGISVIGTVARKKKNLDDLCMAVHNICNTAPKQNSYTVKYSEEIETAVSMLEPIVSNLQNKFPSRWICLKLLENDQKLIKQLSQILGENFINDERIKNTLKVSNAYLNAHNIPQHDRPTMFAESQTAAAESICKGATKESASGYGRFDRKLDKLLTGKYTAYPFMLLLLALVFWITVSGANLPSTALSRLFLFIEHKLDLIFLYFNAPWWLHGLLVSGIFRVVSWVVSVMLPPMAIFFPLFTLLEDSGYLPRIAYNLDKPLNRAGSCGKQALTMSMGFGCNCVGVVGCRIIDSPRERMLATITNNFVPCNGRFPAIITLITLFFVSGSGILSTIQSALWLTVIILLGIISTFIATFVLSKTLLKGLPSSFALELPPYRLPQIGKTILRSIVDRTLFVLGRAIAVAVPSGAVIWLVANIHLSGISLLAHISTFLDPIGQFLGLDGVILMAFILGFPANEIVLPLILMAYTSQGTLIDITELSVIRQILSDNGWTITTAICTVVFSLMHWPCSTALLTIKKETNSLKWTVISALLPTLFGVLLCSVINFLL